MTTISKYANCLMVGAAIVGTGGVILLKATPIVLANPTLNYMFGLKYKYAGDKKAFSTASQYSSNFYS